MCDVMPEGEFSVNMGAFADKVVPQLNEISGSSRLKIILVGLFPVPIRGQRKY